MQTDLLFDQFDTLLTTPDDVAHLEAAVLQLAVRGRVVPQEPDDEPATELFERILAKKERLIREGQIRKPKPLPPIEADEIPYELPESWAWVRLGEATNYGTSDKVKASDIADDTWVLDLQDIEKVTSRLLARVNFSERRPKSSKTVFRKGDVLYGKLRPYLDKVLVVDAGGVCSSEIIPIRGYLDIDPYYLRYALKRPGFIAYVNSKTYGVKMPRLGTPDARMALLPLPPLTEQKRIVARVDELRAQTRALAAQLEQADAALAPTAQAAFQSLLDAQDTTAQHEAWQRIADHFDTLTSDPRTIEALKQTVLQLAVQGKLVPQDPDDEPASAIVKRAKEEKARLVEEKKVRKERNLTPIEGDELPYQTPKGWEWMRLGNLARFIDYRGRTPQKTESGMPLITAKNVRKGYLSEEPREYVDPGIYESWMTRGIPREGDVLFTTEAPLGNVTLLNTDSKVVFAQRIITFQAYGGMNSAFLKYALMSKSIRDMIYSKATGTTARGIKASRLKTVVIPIPPLAEQKRTVAKVEALLALCDALAAEVAAAEEVRVRLLQAVLSGG